MKKASMVLSFMMLLAGSYGSSASAATAVPSVKAAQAAFPDNEFFYQGMADGMDFGDAAAAQYGYGTPDFNAAMDAEIAQAQANAHAGGSADDQYYWYGYKTGLQRKR
jgi:hypothetical protein